MTIGQPYVEGQTTTLEKRDTYEYVALKMLLNARNDLVQNQGVDGNTIGIGALRQYRDNWRKTDGQPFDFSKEGPRPSDYRRLMMMTGATQIQVDGAWEPLDTLDNNRVTDLYKAFSKEYNDGVENGEYRHAITDPELRHTVFNGQIKSSVVTHRGKSLRDTNVGDNVQLYNNKKQRVFTGSVLDGGSSPAPRNQNPFERVEQANRNQGQQRQAGSTRQRPAQSTPNRQQNNQGRQTSNFVNELPELQTGKHFVGWEGDGREFRGLKDVLGAYLTAADGKEVAKNIDNDARFEPEWVAKSLNILKHMRSNGYEFNAKVSANKRNQFSAELANSERTEVRVMDSEDNGTYIGRVYDKYNNYFFRAQGRKTDQVKRASNISAGDTLAILDYVTGNKMNNISRMVKYKGTPGSYVYFDGISNPMHINPTRTEEVDKTKDENKGIMASKVSHRYAAYVFDGASGAETYLDEAIYDARSNLEHDFRIDELEAKVQEGLEQEIVTTDEFKASLDGLYSMNPFVRDAQEAAVQDRIHKLISLEESRDTFLDEYVGSLEDGFDPSVVIDNMNPTGRGNSRDSMMSAIKRSGYDVNKLKGNDFAVHNIKSRVIAFDAESAKTLDEIEDPTMRKALQMVQDTLENGKFIGSSDDEKSKPKVMVDEQGIIRWEAARPTNSKKEPFEEISGEIGQVMTPDENGIIKTNFQGDRNYGFVPGYTGYFAFDGTYENRMDRFRVKGFDQHLIQQIQSKVAHQMTRPYEHELQNIATTLDASDLNGLYQKDVYGKRIDPDFMETGMMDTDTKKAVLQTLSNRVRFDNQYSEHATTFAESRANQAQKNGTSDVEDTASYSYWQAAGEKNMRVLHDDLTNIADLTMTGTGKTQGVIWYLTDGAKVNDDGTVTPSEGMYDEKGDLTLPDATAVQKLDHFKYKDNNAWDRNQMAANQLMTALRVDKKAKTAMMSFGGWTFDDSYAVSKEFAERNPVFGDKPNDASKDELKALLGAMQKGLTAEEAVQQSGNKWSSATLNQGLEMLQANQDSASLDNDDVPSFDAYIEEHGRYRPLQRGDKVSDFGGNKGTIGIVIDRNMPAEEAKEKQLENEVAIMKANPDLDVVSAPYSMLSRHNAGVIKELQSGEVQDLYNPVTGETHKGAIGELDIIVTDMVVDDKTHAYSEQDIKDGKGRRASGQLAWALQAKGAEGILNEIYGKNEGPWSTYREYLISTGLDMQADGTLKKGYTPHAGEERHVFQYEDTKSDIDFLRETSDKGGFLELPFDVHFKTSEPTNQLPIMSASLRQDTELVDGSMRVNDFTNEYVKIYNALGDYHQAETQYKKNKQGEDEIVKTKEQVQEDAKNAVQNSFDQIQSTIIDRQFNGGNNGKHSFLRDKVMGKRMQNSATGVAIVDPRLNIGEAGMNQEMMDALNAKEGDVVMAWRDPIWRDGGVRSFTVKHDEEVHGISVNPISDKSHDMDFDGDTMGIVKLESKEALHDLENKFSHWSNMIDYGDGNENLYYQVGKGSMDLKSAEAQAEQKGDTKSIELLDNALATAKKASKSPYENPDYSKENKRRQDLKKSLRDLNDYSHKMYRSEYGYGGAVVDLTNDKTVEASFEKMVNDGAKGSQGKLDTYMNYHNGEMTPEDARDIQYATGIKSDDTGLAGSHAQKLVAILRNQNTTAALEATYPFTQGVLQIKHDAKHARDVNDNVLTTKLPQVLSGKHATKKDTQLTPDQFKQEFGEVMKTMGVEVDEKHVDTITDALSNEDKTQMIGVEKAIQMKGSPMDRVAYGGGYDELKFIAENEESLLEGKYNELFAPVSMRKADVEKDVLAKKDTQQSKKATQVEAGQQEVAQGQTQAASSVEPKSIASTLAVREPVTPTPERTVQMEMALDDDVDYGPDL